LHWRHSCCSCCWIEVSSSNVLSRPSTVGAASRLEAVCCSCWRLAEIADAGLSDSDAEVLLLLVLRLLLLCGLAALV
jgi:hypothetical protein